MATKSIKVTPILGGNSDGAVCSLLEIGGFRILLDCGSSNDLDHDIFVKVALELSISGGIDAIVLSHADVHHIGGLPLLLGKNGLQNIPVICTLPVFKFGQIVLYDYHLNRKLEGDKYLETFDLDDVDSAFRNVQTVKYSQTINIIKKDSSTKTTVPEISLCAIQSGRTIGGAIWRIRCGPAEVLYTMDVNLRKETVLDGASLDLLPTGPALLIVEGSAGSRKKKEKDESTAMISTVMETLRGGGNVLIPCETGGRILELLQLLGKHWLDNKIGMYHLVFLSHMARNVPEFGRMQLEWMSDVLSRGFYNGKPNPFELPQVKFVTSLREMERLCPGPKVVLATDASLSFGLSKELLLRWGGDPRCKVIFTDQSDSGSLAAELRSKHSSPPVIATVSKPNRVELAGEELAEFRREAEKARRSREEAVTRKRRQDELQQLNAGKQQEEDPESDGEGESSSVAGSSSGGAATSLSSVSSPHRKRNKTAFAAKFMEPNVVMFETREDGLWGDEFGVSNDDLTFVDISSIDTKWQPKEKSGEVVTSRPIQPVVQVVTASAVNEKVSVVDDIPWKLVASKLRVQFTCEFKELNLSARADLKAIKTLTGKVSPARLVVLGGSVEDCQSILEFAKASGIEAHAPVNNSCVSFQVLSEKLKVQIPQNLLPGAMRALKVFSSTTAALAETKCTVSTLSGLVLESRTTSGQEGTRFAKYQGGAAPSDAVVVSVSGGSQQLSTENPSESALQSGEADGTVLDGVDTTITVRDPSIGVVSVGEVTMSSLRQLVEASGTPVEFRLTAGGGILVCDGQVIISKDANNEFVLEGPPVPAYYVARQALYQQFAFV